MVVQLTYYAAVSHNGFSYQVSGSSEEEVYEGVSILIQKSINKLFGWLVTLIVLIIADSIFKFDSWGFWGTSFVVMYGIIMWFKYGFPWTHIILIRMWQRARIEHEASV